MPTLKLKTASSPDNPAHHATSSAAATPASASDTPKPGLLKLKVSQPPTPASEQPTASLGNGGTKQAKAGGAAAKKPKASGGSKKRPANDDIAPAPKRAPTAPSRKISLKPPVAPTPGMEHIPASAGGLNRIMLKRRSTVPKLKQLNVKRPPPPRIPGVGYDSEDSDAEEDPAIQQTFILRMQPGEDCQYLREAIANGKIGAPPNEGPAEVHMRFLDKDFRRATVTIRGRMYAAALVDLPCIVETMKSWEKKNWWKVADLNQMLLVLGRCDSEEQAKTFPLPREVDQSNMQYPHGLTPPMHWVRKRRFRKRLSYKTIANVEEEVERLLREDAACKENGGDVTIETLNRADLERMQEPGSHDDDADGEIVDSTEVYEEYDEGDSELVANLQAMFEADANSSSLPTVAADGMVATDSPSQMTNRAPTFPMTGDVSSTPAGMETPSASTPFQPSATEGEESSGDEDEAASDDGSGDRPADAVEDEDEDAKAAKAERMQQLEEVRDLEREVENQRRKVESQKNMLLRERAAAQLRILEEDLRVKKGVFGLDGDGDDGDGNPQYGQGDGDDGLFGEDEDAEGESEEE